MPDITSVFILAENRLLREALTRLLSKKSDIRVAGACALSVRTIEQIVNAAPDVLVADQSAVSLPGLQFVPEVRTAIPGLKVVMIGMDSDREIFLKAVRDGIAGYVLKDASAQDIATAIRLVANNEAACPPGLCWVLFEQVAAERHTRFAFRLKHNLSLTRREQELVQMVGRGLTNREIAAELNLSEQTVKNHIHRILRKLGASDRLAAVELCRMPEVPVA